MNDSSDKWVRRFTTDATSKHKNGFTIYKITSYIFPLASPEAVTVLTVWKRYNDLQKLQNLMKKMHQDLYLKGTCPSYTKWGYFRRFDAEVIEDRRNCTQALLEFVALHPPLFTSTEFVNFFQSSYPDPGVDNQNTSPGNIDSIRSSLLLPVEVMAPLEYQSSEDDSFSTVDSPSASTLETASLEGSIVYRNNSGQPITRYTKSPQPEITPVENVAEIVVLPEPLRPNVASILDTTSSIMSSSQISNVSDVSSPNSTLKNTTKLNLPDLISFDIKANLDPMQLSTDSSTDSLSFLDSIVGPPNPIENTKQDDIFVESSIDAGLTNGSGYTDSKITSPNKSKLKLEQSVTVEPKDLMESSFNSTLTRSSSRLDSVSIDSIFGSSSDLQESYVFEAGYLLSLGARNEAMGEYQRAFDFYKAGIEKMLIGAQGDTNEFRKQFVKDKTNKYLSYAEKIYNNHLNNLEGEMLDDSSRAPDHRSSTTVVPVKHCDVSALCRPHEELGKYRVLGVIGGQVMLVLYSETQQYYAMKVIQKTCNQVPDEDYFKCPEVDSKSVIMPTDIPHMVKLVAYVETSNHLFLVLQYASGGRLFDYIKNYVKSVPETPCREVNLENVFVDPEELNKKSNGKYELEAENCDLENNRKNCDSFNRDRGDCNNSESSDKLKIDLNESCDNLSVTDMVVNSQRLLLNVDDALCGRFQRKKAEADRWKDISNSNAAQGDKLSEIVSEVERTFDGLQERLDQIVIEEDSNNTLRNNRSALPPRSLCNWGAELLVALHHLHMCGVICRNLNPSNLLLGERGYLMLSYMVGKSSRQSLVPLLQSGALQRDVCVAPELQRYPLLDEGYDERVADYWSFGAILFELITGIPLSVAHPSGFTSHTILNLPSDLSKDAESILSQLLCFDPKERLGSGPDGINEIKSHPYFKQIDWDSVEEEAKNT